MPEESQKKKRILLVEDVYDLKLVMKTILETHGFDVVTASNGKAALSLYNDSFDIILTDLAMPEMGGVELIREIKKINPGAICLVITGYTDIYVPEEIPLIHKPVSSSQLVAFVEYATKLY